MNIFCWFCNTDNLKIELIMANKPKKPHLSITCAECETGGQGLWSVEISKSSVELLRMGLDLRDKQNE